MQDDELKLLKEIAPLLHAWKSEANEVKNNKSLRGKKDKLDTPSTQKKSTMCPGGWRKRYEYWFSPYLPSRFTRRTAESLVGWKNFREALFSKLDYFLKDRFQKFCSPVYKQTVNEYESFGVPSLAQAGFVDMQSEPGFGSNISITYNDFSNELHVDNDAQTFAYGMWVPTTTLGECAYVDDGFECIGGELICANYGIAIDFGSCDGIVESAWRGSEDWHATMASTSKDGFTRLGMSVQIPKSLVAAVKQLKLEHSLDLGMNIETRVHGISFILGSRVSDD